MMYHPEEFGVLNGDSVTDASNTLKENKSLLTWENNRMALDIGCGPGDITANVLRHFLPSQVSLIGCDISNDMVTYGNKNFKTEKLSFKIMDISDENLCDTWGRNITDKIFSFYTMHRIENGKAAFKNMYNLLKPGGEIFLVSPTLKHPMMMVYANLLKLAKYNDYHEKIKHLSSNCWLNSKSEVENLVRDSGLKIVKCEFRPSKYMFKSMDEFMHLFETVTPLKQLVPPSVFKDIMNDAKSIIEETKLMIENDSGCLSNYVLLVTIARKALTQ